MAGVTSSAKERAEGQKPDAETRSRGDSGAARGDAKQNKIVISEMEEFVLGMQLKQGTRKPEAEDVFTDEHDDAASSCDLAKDGATGLDAIREEADVGDEVKVGQGEEVIKRDDEVGREAAVGKGLAGALKFFKERGTLNEGTDKEENKLVGVQDGSREIHIERTDEFGRVMTPKEAFRELSHKFHGKGSGKMKQEKRLRKYQDELKTKRMKATDTPLLSAKKTRDAQARGKTPYIGLTGKAKSSELV